MSRIEDAVAGVRYEKNPYYAYRYDQETVDGIEAMVGRTLPEDMRWYLLNIGRLGLEYDHSFLPVQRGEALLTLRFEGVEDPIFSKSRYDHFLERKEGGRLAGEARHYYPLCEIKGEFNPSVALRLLVDLNEGASYGSIWGVRPIGHFDDQTPSEPIRVAAGLVEFLGLIGPERALREKAEKHNGALFRRLFSDELARRTVVPSDAGAADLVLKAYFERPDDIALDGARNVEFDHHVGGRRFETSADLADTVRFFAKDMPTNAFHCSAMVVRRDVRFGAAEPYDGGFVGQKLSPGFMVMTATSTVGEDLVFDEQYLLYHEAKADRWTIVRRLHGKIKDVKVKGVGTFAYDSAYKWHLKKKVTPAWAEFKLEVTLDGEETALTPQRIDFIREITGNAAFRPVFEAHVFRLYKERYYPDFEAMDADEKKDWVKDFPKIDEPSQIWSLFGRKASIRVHANNAFTLHVEAGFDPEHGLDMRVEDWRIDR